MKIEHLIELLSSAARGIDNIKEGAVGSNGYGFVFRNFDYNSLDSFFLIGDGSSKFCSLGVYKYIYNKSLRGRATKRDLEELYNCDLKPDLHFGGALKSLVSDIEFGGEYLFEVWMFVKTPRSRIFPATLYYGQSGPSVGAWSSDYRAFLFTDGGAFTQEFQAIINFNPFDFSDLEKEEFIEALEFSLAKVPVSDFEGIFQHDRGSELMGVKSGKPFIKSLKDEVLNKRRKIGTWSYSIMGNDEAWDFHYEFIKIAIYHLTTEENERYPRKIPENLFRVLIGRSYNLLIAHAQKKKSRLAFMVLGRFLMLHKVEMTEKNRREIFKYSDWEFEKHQFKNSKDIEERKEFLEDFRSKIEVYDGLMKVRLPLYTVAHVISEKEAKGDTSPIWRQNIDYSIEN